MMNLTRRLILALAMIAGSSPSMAQVPPPVPALPDTQRIGAFNITASTCNCSVPFAFFADQTDYQNWVKVYLNGAQVQYNDPVYGWKITSPTGVIGLIAQPITDAILNFNTAQTGAVQIVGARRPRRVSQFSENAGVSARALNETITDIVAQNRENWDLAGSALHGTPGANYGAVPSNCPNAGLGFDSTGLNFVCTAGSLTGISQYIGAVVAATPATILPNSPVYANGSAGVGATITAGSNGALSVDGIALAVGNRVLVKDQASTFQNGVYVISQVGSVSAPYILTRVTDFDAPSEMIAATAVIVTGGTVNGGAGWLLTGTVTTVGATPAIFTQFSAKTVDSLGGVAGNIGLRASLNITNGSLGISGNIFNIADYGAVADYHESTVLSTGAGSTTVAATGSPFTPAMVGSLINITGAAASGATYFGSIVGYTSPTSITISPAATTAQTNVFGQFCQDNTPAIQSAINAARAANGGTILIPDNGTYCVQQLDLTNGPSMVLKGAATVNGSRLMPMRSTNSVMDWTGTSQPNLDGISVGQYNQLAVPYMGLVISPSNPVSGIDFANLRNVFWTGNYQGATLYVDRAASSTCQKSSFLNYYQGSANTGFTAIFTHNNIFSFSSAFATTFVGAESVSDWNFTGCEFHSINQAGGVAAYAALYLDGVGNIQFFGGNMATSHATIIQINNANSNLLFNGTTFYSDTGPAAVNVFSGAGTMDRVVLTCTNNGISGAVVGGTGGATNVVQSP